MSLGPMNDFDLLDRFPRVSGDEPITLDVKGATVEFSPRERG